MPVSYTHLDVYKRQAPIYAQCNIATDNNQLMMEVMKKVAYRHGLVCLLHEKPFAGVNGSGKHNNWSITCLLYTSPAIKIKEFFVYIS